MKKFSFLRSLPIGICAGALCFCQFAAAQEIQLEAAQNTETSVLDDDSAVSVLTRGALHESFATVYLADPIPGSKVAKRPPEPIEELPPDYKPEGNNVEWIPGYWEWDGEEESDFIWISGIWRDIPPKQQWVPGYWQEFEDGYRRVSGFFTKNELDEVTYLPQPPKAVESGPSAPAPGPEHFYVPGSWEYVNSQYNWRPGYWAPARENWVWIPDQYVWTPRGCVFVNGYWDYEVQYRGVVFAPVRFETPIYTNRNYVYTPRYTIDSDVNLLVHLFYRGNNHQYYFGDYYGDNYRDTYHPWVGARANRTAYDPLYSYYSVNFPNRNVDYINWIDERHNYYVDHQDVRPPRTMRDQIRFFRTSNEANISADVIRLSTLGVAIADLTSGNNGNFHFSKLNDDQRRGFEDSRRPYRSVARGRSEFEVRGERVLDDVRDRVTGNEIETDRSQTDRRQERTLTNDPSSTATLRLRELREQFREDDRDRLDNAGKAADRVVDRVEGATERAADRLKDRTGVMKDRTDGQLDRRSDNLRGTAGKSTDRLNSEILGRPSRPIDWPGARGSDNGGKRNFDIPEVPKFGGGDPGSAPRGSSGKKNGKDK